uniref:Thioredoxin n=1 Tax=Mimachlamys nobilis TaxID=106276 RepID=A0A1Y0B6I1_MIMNO|nr:thioredoxin-like protein [Mimachlamys nobilis]
MGVKILETQAEFDELIKTSDKLVVVDFYADWCGPCKKIAPEIEKMSTGEHSDVTFVKVNVDENEETAAVCQVSAMPTFLFYKGGIKVDNLVGANEEKLQALIKKNK